MIRSYNLPLGKPCSRVPFPSLPVAVFVLSNIIITMTLIFARVLDQ
jgi:hypothetical protein